MPTINQHEEALEFEASMKPKSGDLRPLKKGEKIGEIEYNPQTDELNFIPKENS